jgi:hypothetical protein
VPQLVQLELKLLLEVHPLLLQSHRPVQVLHSRFRPASELQPGNWSPYARGAHLVPGANCPILGSCMTWAEREVTAAADPCCFGPTTFFSSSSSLGRTAGPDRAASCRRRTLRGDEQRDERGGKARGILHAGSTHDGT